MPYDARLGGPAKATAGHRRNSETGPLPNRNSAEGGRRRREVSTLSGRETDGQAENVFLSPEAEAIVRQMCGIYFSPAARKKSESAIREEFTLSLALYLGVEGSSVQSIAESLFDATLQVCDRALSAAVDKGILAAHEAKSSIRNRILLDEIANIQKNVEFLRHAQQPKLEDILQFEVKYRAQLADRHGHIIPPHFDVARKIPIKEICVSPNLAHLSRNRNDQGEPLKFDVFLSGLYRAVVLGNPGGGKSTLASRICHDLALDHRLRILGKRQLTAALVVLRDYGAAKKEHDCSFLQFIETVANSHYQIPPPKGAIEYMLLNGRAMVIFDGLDELLDTRHRQEISADIESFCNLYPSVPVLVTSREVGYEQAPLDEARFMAYRLAPFDNQQVEEYARKWFAADRELPPPQQKQKAESFLKESEVVSDLRSNPLMLSLMCNLYRGDNYIPKNRPDVYEKCATMLFERWDKSRGIFVPLPFEAHINPAMKYLAHWIYADDALQAGVTEQKLVAKATEYLALRRFEDRDEAEQAARGFIDFCRGRAWVFTDTGTTKSGDRLYQFTHRTFLEYFTAAHLVRTNPTPDQLISVLMPRIEAREWDVVAQLAFQLQNKQVEGAADDLLVALLKRSATVQGSRAWHLLSFAARSLEFLVPTPKTTREIALACLAHSFGLAKTQGIESHARSEQPAKHFALFADLLTATGENRSPITDCVEKDISRRIDGPEVAESLFAIDAGLNLRLGLHLGRHHGEVGEDSYRFWGEVSERIFNSCSVRILELARKDRPTWMYCYLRGRVEIASFFELFSHQPLFADYPHRMFPEVRSGPLANLLLWPAVSGARDGAQLRPEFEARLRDLSTVGKVLLRITPPWFENASGHREFPYRHWNFDPDQDTGDLDLDPDTTFGGLAIAAVQLNSWGDVSEMEPMVRFLTGSKSPLFRRIGWVLSARLNPKYLDRASEQLASLGLSTEQGNLMSAWMNRRIQLATTAGRGRP